MSLPTAVAAQSGAIIDVINDIAHPSLLPTQAFY